MASFKAQLGRADRPGLASQAERFKRIVQGQNPYLTGESLPPDSPVLFGRERELAETLGVLRRADKPGSVSMLGERRFGKSSFLNHVYQALRVPGSRWRRLVAHWVGILEGEARQAREWLRLELDAPELRFVRGDRTLRLRVRNPTGEPARSIAVMPEPAAELVWVHPQARLDLLEGGKETDIRLDFRAAQEGAVRIAGQLTAQDLDGNPFVLPFAFRIQVALAGRPYRSPSYQPYVTGEGLGSDRAYVGRADLLGWLRGLWLQPDGKPAVVLIGQRRIGKTSLLNKIARDGLPDTGLLPIVVNIQGVGSEYDFLKEIAGRMAEHLGQDAPQLDPAEPYASFKSFVNHTRVPLGPRRFLPMLDEADLMPERGLGNLLPGFLRALMQEHQYPTVTASSRR